VSQDTQDTQSSKGSDWVNALSALVAVFKDCFTLVKDILIITAAAVFLGLLFFHRATVRSVFSNLAGQLETAKLTKANLGVVEVSFLDNAQKVRSATDAIQDTHKSLLSLVPSVHDQVVKNKLEEIVQKLDDASAATKSAEESLQKSGIQQQTSPTAAVQTAITSSGSGDWAVVVSADKEVDLAQYEVDVLKRIGFPKAEIVERRGWLRTVVLFPNQNDADAALDQIRQRRRNTAYIATMTHWCPQTQKDPKTGFDVCLGMSTD
jgi:hypothetical protein